jgi:hypothetical protein
MEQRQEMTLWNHDLVQSHGGGDPLDHRMPMADQFAPIRHAPTIRPRVVLIGFTNIVQ